jgi:hypothetical protein
MEELDDMDVLDSTEEIEVREQAEAEKPRSSVNGS